MFVTFDISVPDNENKFWHDSVNSLLKDLMIYYITTSPSGYRDEDYVLRNFEKNKVHGLQLSNRNHFLSTVSRQSSISKCVRMCQLLIINQIMGQPTPVSSSLCQFRLDVFQLWHTSTQLPVASVSAKQHFIVKWWLLTAIRFILDIHITRGRFLGPTTYVPFYSWSQLRSNADIADGFGSTTVKFEHMQHNDMKITFIHLYFSWYPIK